MVGRRALGTIAVSLVLAVGFLGTLAVGVAHAQQSCCQCPLPTCGPPNNGKCGPGCTLIAKARCDGRTGRCEAQISLNTNHKGLKFANLQSPNDHTDAQLLLIGGSR